VATRAGLFALRFARRSRHPRRAPGSDVAVARWRVVTSRAHVARQDRSARARLGDRARAVTSGATNARESAQRRRQRRP
jgi:hypothetical protein